MNILPGMKTYLAAAGIVVTAIIAFLHGDSSLSDAILTVLNGLGLAALRNGVATVAKS